MPREKPTPQDVSAYVRAMVVDFQEEAIFRRLMNDDAARRALAQAGRGGFK